MKIINRADGSIKIREIYIKSFENLQKKNIIITQAELSDDARFIVLVYFFPNIILFCISIES